MKRLFISQPMRGKTKEEILSVRQLAIEEAERELGERVEVIESYFEDAPNDGNVPLWHLGKSIVLLSSADAVYFAKGWEDARGCRIERICAEQYGVRIIE